MEQLSPILQSHKGEKRGILVSLKWGRGGPDIPFILSKIMCRSEMVSIMAILWVHTYTCTNCRLFKTKSFTITIAACLNV